METGFFGAWPSVTWMRTITFGRPELSGELRASMLLWGARMGCLWGLAMSIDSLLCLATQRPLGTNYIYRFLGGSAAGYVFCFTDRVAGPTRMLMALGLGTTLVIFTQ